MQKYARFIDPEHRRVWEQLGTPKGEIGMILRKITTEFKFVSAAAPFGDIGRSNVFLGGADDGPICLASP